MNEKQGGTTEISLGNQGNYYVHTAFLFLLIAGTPPFSHYVPPFWFSKNHGLGFILLLFKFSSVLYTIFCKILRVLIKKNFTPTKFPMVVNW